MEKSVFQILNEYDITEHLKKKDRIIYLPWSKAWMIVKSLFPSAKFTINKAADGCIYHTDGKTAWVEVSITINDQTETESLAVMDFRNKSIPIDTITSADAEKSIKRCLVKCAALHGLGLSLWTGEELSSAARKKKEDDLDDVKQEILSVVAGKLEAGVSKDTIYKANQLHISYVAFGLSADHTYLCEYEVYGQTTRMCKGVASELKAMLKPEWKGIRMGYQVEGHTLQ